MSYFIFSWKRYWATHSLLFEICSIFFSVSGKKNIVQKFQIIKIWAGEPWWTPPKWQKNDLMSYISEKIQIHIMLSGFFVMKMVIEDLLCVFFFPRKLGAGKKNTAIFSHSRLFGILILKVNFPGKKKIRHLCSNRQKNWPHIKFSHFLWISHQSSLKKSRYINKWNEGKKGKKKTKHRKN